MWFVSSLRQYADSTWFRKISMIKMREKFFLKQLFFILFILFLQARITIGRNFKITKNPFFGKCCSCVTTRIELKFLRVFKNHQSQIDYEFKQNQSSRFRDMVIWVTDFRYVMIGVGNFTSQLSTKLKALRDNQLCWTCQYTNRDGKKKDLTNRHRPAR